VRYFYDGRKAIMNVDTQNPPEKPRRESCELLPETKPAKSSSYVDFETVTEFDPDDWRDSSTDEN